MGVGGISIWQLLIILVIVVLLFGTKKLRNMGGDLGSAIKSFKKAVSDKDAAADKDAAKAGLEDRSTAGQAQETAGAKKPSD